MNVELLKKLQAELAINGCHVCGEDIGAILIADSYKIDLENMKIFTDANKKYTAEIVKF